MTSACASIVPLATSPVEDGDRIDGGSSTRAAVYDIEDAKTSDDGTEGRSQVCSRSGLMPNYSTMAGTLYPSSTRPLQSVSSWLKRLTPRNSNTSAADVAAAVATVAATPTQQSNPTSRTLRSVAHASSSSWDDMWDHDEVEAHEHGDEEGEEKIAIDGSDSNTQTLAQEALSSFSSEEEQDCGRMPTLSAGPYLSTSSSMTGRGGLAGHHRASSSYSHSHKQERSFTKATASASSNRPASLPARGTSSSRVHFFDPHLIVGADVTAAGAATTAAASGDGGGSTSSTVLLSSSTATTPHPVGAAAGGVGANVPPGRSVSSNGGEATAHHHYPVQQHHHRHGRKASMQVPRLGMLQSAQDLIASSAGTTTAATRTPGTTPLMNDFNRRASDSDVTRVAKSTTPRALGDLTSAAEVANFPPAPTTGWRAALPRLSLTGPPSFPWESSRNETPMERSREWAGGATANGEGETRGLKATAKTLKRKMFNLPGPKHILQGERTSLFNCLSLMYCFDRRHRRARPGS